MILSKTPWKSHPWNKSKQVELISVDFLLKYCNPSPTNETDLHTGEIVHQDVVWENIKEEGMHEPLMLRINPGSNEIRLESGNHRVRLAKRDKLLFLPVATFITNQTIFHLGNGTHTFSIPDGFNASSLIRCPYDYQIKLRDHIANKSLFLN